MSPFVFDLVVLIIIVGSAVISFIRGFVKEVLTIVALAGAAIAAWFAGPHLKPHTLDWLDGEDGKTEMLFDLIPVQLASDALAYILVFVITFIVLTILSHMTSKAVNGVGMGAVDRSLGVVFGLARGLVLVVLLYLPFSVMVKKDDYPEWVTKAHSYPLVDRLAQTGKSWLPEKEVEDKLEETADKIEDKLENPATEGYDEKSRKALDKLMQKETTE